MATYLGATETFDHALACAAAHYRWDRDESMGDLPDTTSRRYYASATTVNNCFPFFRASGVADILATFPQWNLTDLYPVPLQVAPQVKG